MAKTLNGNVELQFHSGSEEPYCTIKYRVNSEGLGENRALQVPLTLAQLTILNNFITNVAIPQIKQAEGIP